MLLSSIAQAAETGVGLGAQVDTSEGASGDATADGSAPAPSSPEDDPAPESSGFEHGMRLGISLPIGKTGGGNLRSGEMSGIVGVRIPIWLDLGYRLDTHWWVGLAPELGLGTVGDDCGDDQECEWSDLRLSAQAIYSLSPGSSVDPWLGLGLGWEWLRGSVTLTVPPELSGLDQEVAIRARELLGGPQVFAQGGMRFDVGETLTVGPYVAASAGMFISDTFDCPEFLACPTETDVDDKQIHAWVGLGLRGTHGP